MVSMFRRRARRRSSMPRAVVQSYKKVINFAPASIGSGSANQIFVTGVDSVAAGQTGPTDSGVPTGSVIRFVEIQIALGQIVGGAVFVHYSLQLLRGGQAAVPSNVIGGSNRRNQVLHQNMFQLGINQNFNRTLKMKIPRMFQRVREGDLWLLEVTTSNTLTQAYQIIYKFFR